MTGAVLGGSLLGGAAAAAGLALLQYRATGALPALLAGWGARGGAGGAAAAQYARVPGAGTGLLSASPQTVQMGSGL
jgi:hypothetical protein